MKWKINLIAVIIFSLLSLLFFRILYIQLIKKDYKNFLQKQLLKQNEIKNLRGTIYDRNGEPLAFSVFKNSYFCFVQKIKDPTDFKNFTINKLGIDENKINEILTQRRGFYWLKRQADEEFEKTELPTGIDFIKEEKRVYPNANLASHVLGYTGIDNNGLSGLEFQFDKILAGSKIKIKEEKDAQGRGVSSDKIFILEDNKSQNLFLTIDKNIQVFTEKYLDELMKKSKPKKAMIIVQDTKTSEILAMAIRNDNKYRISAISDIYEPGSTIKVLVVGAALQEKIVKLSDKIYCEHGKYKIFDRIIKDHDQEHAKLTIEDILVYSSNIGMAKLGDKLGKNLLYKYFQKFNFGMQTGIELPGEAFGLIKHPTYWYNITPFIVSFGQSLGITALQTVNAFSAIANNGLMLEPHIIKKIQNDKNFKITKPRKIRKLFTQTVCDELLKSMYSTSERGTAKDAKVTGYKVGGKTGTAQKIDPLTKKYSTKDYISSFVGIFPIDKPQFAILVVADSPEGVYWGGNVCGPTFSKIARDLAIYYKILQNLRIDSK